MSEEMPASSYPPFRPPVRLAASSPATWSLAEARQYFTWLTSVQPKRIATLLQYLGETDQLGPTELLRQVGQRTVWVLQKPAFTTNREASARFTELGYSLAADVGLLVAKLLTDTDSAIRWEILRRPKSEISFNQPVLVGFGRLHLDPIRGSVAEAARILRGEPDPEAWVRIYTFWKSRVDTSSVRQVTDSK